MGHTSVFGPDTSCWHAQVQQEALAKEYANTRYEQPYQTAMYEAAVLLHHRRWHTREYEAVVGKLAAPDLEVRHVMLCPWPLRQWYLASWGLCCEGGPGDTYCETSLHKNARCSGTTAHGTVRHVDWHACCCPFPCHLHLHPAGSASSLSAQLKVCIEVWCAHLSAGVPGQADRALHRGGLRHRQLLGSAGR